MRRFNHVVCHMTCIGAQEHHRGKGRRARPSTPLTILIRASCSVQDDCYRVDQEHRWARGEHRYGFLFLSIGVSIAEEKLKRRSIVVTRNPVDIY